MLQIDDELQRLYLVCFPSPCGLQNRLSQSQHRRRRVRFTRFPTYPPASFGPIHHESMSTNPWVWCSMCGGCCCYYPIAPLTVLPFGGLVLGLAFALITGPSGSFLEPVVLLEPYRLPSLFTRHPHSPTLVHSPSFTRPRSPTLIHPHSRHSPPSFARAVATRWRSSLAGR